MNRQETFENLCIRDINSAIVIGFCPLCGGNISSIPGSKIGDNFIGDSYSLYYECLHCETEFEKHVKGGHSITFRAYF